MDKEAYLKKIEECAVLPDDLDEYPYMIVRLEDLLDEAEDEGVEPLCDIMLHAFLLIHRSRMEEEYIVKLEAVKEALLEEQRVGERLDLKGLNSIKNALVGWFPPQLIGFCGSDMKAEYEDDLDFCKRETHYLICVAEGKIKAEDATTPSSREVNLGPVYNMFAVDSLTREKEGVSRELKHVERPRLRVKRKTTRERISRLGRKARDHTNSIDIAFDSNVKAPAELIEDATMNEVSIMTKNKLEELNLSDACQEEEKREPQPIAASTLAIEPETIVTEALLSNKTTEIPPDATITTDISVCVPKPGAKSPMETEIASLDPEPETQLEAKPVVNTSAPEPEKATVPAVSKTKPKMQTGSNKSVLSRWQSVAAAEEEPKKKDVNAGRTAKSRKITDLAARFEAK